MTIPSLTPGSGVSYRVTVPNVPGLVGRRIYVQGLTGMSPGTGDAKLTNMRSVVVQEAP